MEQAFFSREELMGKIVADQEAIIIGKVKDLALTKDGKMGLIVDGDGKTEKFVLLNFVQKIGDIVLLKPKEAISPPSSAPPAQKQETPKEAPRICKNCGSENNPTAKFCVKCGKGL